MNLNQIAELYVSCVEIEDRDALGWSWWALEGLPSGEVHELDTDTHLQKTFALKLLMEAARLSEDALRAHSLPPARSLVPLIGTADPSIRPFYTEIQQHPEDWAGILTPEAIAKIPALLSAFDNTLLAQRRDEELKVIQAPLSPSKVDDFFRTATQAFNESGVLNSLGKHHEFIREDLKAPAPEGSPASWGYNQVSSKEAFIDDWHVHFVDFGQQFGRGLARSEDSRGFRALVDALPTWQEPAGGAGDAWGRIGQAFRHLRDSGVKANAILTSLDFEDMALLRQSESFIPKWHRDCPSNDNVGFVGAFRASADEMIPVFRFYLDRQQAQSTGVCIVRLESIGELVRLNPGPDNAQPSEIRGPFYLRVRDLNAADADRQLFLDKKPAWLEKHANPEHYLRGRVLIQFHERVEYRFQKAASAGIKLQVPGDPEQ